MPAASLLKMVVSFVFGTPVSRLPVRGTPLERFEIRGSHAGDDLAGPGVSATSRRPNDDVFRGSE
jgi:hypothetical protein